MLVNGSITYLFNSIIGCIVSFFQIHVRSVRIQPTSLGRSRYIEIFSRAIYFTCNATC